MSAMSLEECGRWFHCHLFSWSQWGS